MNKRNKLGPVLAYVKGYHIRTILNHGKDSGKCAIYAGKHKVSDEVTTNVVNIDKFKNYISIETNVCDMIRNGIRIKGVKSLRTKKTYYTVYNKEGLPLDTFKSKDKAIKFANLQK